MTLQLDHNQLQKLTHELLEIRLRALDQVESRFTQLEQQNETTTFKPAHMAKQLIRWIGMKPLCEEQRVLALLLKLLRSCYAPALLKKISNERLRIELDKVRIIVNKNAAAVELVDQIKQLLREQRLREQVDSEVEREMVHVPAVERIKLSTEDSNNNYSSSSSSLTTAEALYAAHTAEDYEEPWTRPSISDITSMKLIADLLLNNLATTENLENALVHLQITMQDYPAEYLLQTPHLFQKLLQLHARNNEHGPEPSYSMALLNRTLLTYLRQLYKRILMRRKTLNYAAQTTAQQSNARTQLKVQTALKLLLERVLAQIEPLLIELHACQWQLIELLQYALKLYRLLGNCVPQYTVQQLAMLAKRLRCYYMNASVVNVPRLKYMLLVELLQEAIMHNNSLTTSAEQGENKTIELLRPLLVDYALKVCQPERAAALDIIFSSSYVSYAIVKQQLERFTSAYTFAIEQLSNSSSSSKEQRLAPEKLLTQHAQLTIVLESLCSLRLVKSLFNAIIACNAQYTEEPTLLKEAKELLNRLLQLRNERLRLAVHKLLRAKILQHFHCLMNCENYVAGKSNAQLVAAHIFGVPLSVELLQQLITLSYADASNDVRQYCLDCICLLLKTETLLKADFKFMLDLMLPVMPLLISCAAKNEDLLQLLLQLHHPDTSCIDFFPLLRGNICLLYHPSEAVRSETLSRVIYMLRCKDQQCTLLPDLRQVKDMLQHDICLVQPPRDFLYIFNDRQPDGFTNQRTMFSLLKLLDSLDIEPLIRKTTLMQLNIMLQSWAATRQFCEYDAYIFPLKALHNSIAMDSAMDYTDAAIPAVGMLAKLFLHNAAFRSELVRKEEVHILLLRALFHFGHDIPLKQDASLCLFLLAFDAFVHVTERGVELDKIITELHVPINYSIKAAAKNEAFEEQKQAAESLLRYCFGNSAEAAQQYWRLHIASIICGGHETVTLEKINSYDIAIELKLSKHELLLLQSTQTALQLKRFLDAAANATSHEALEKLIVVLQLYLLQLRDTVPPHLAAELQHLLGKYLKLEPANAEDHELFVQMLSLCCTCIRQGLKPVIVGFNTTLQADINHGFVTLLQHKDNNVQLYQQVAHCLSQLIGATEIATHSNNLWFGSLFEHFSELRRQFFVERDLLSVRCLLGVLRELCVHPLAFSDRQLHDYCRQFIRLSYELKANTQTGAQCQRDCLRIVCQLHAQMETPDAIFRFSNNVLSFLAGLCGHTDAEVRALAWTVLASIATGYAHDALPEYGSKQFLEELKFLPGGFLASTLSTLLDHYETMLVRQMAARVFTLMFKQTPVKDLIALLERHAFLHIALKGLEKAQLNEQLPHDFNALKAGALDSSAVIGGYVHICIEIVKLQPSWAQQLSGHAFVHKLYELLKLPPTPINAGYRQLCAQICQLYTLFYDNANDFLRRSVCRDPVLLSSLIHLLHEMLTVTSLEELMPLVKFLLVLCKDDTAYGFICQQLALQPEVLVQLCAGAFELQYINTSIQRYTLSTLTLLLIKSQQRSFRVSPLNENVSLVAILEQHITTNGRMNSISRSSFTLNKENDINELNLRFGSSLHISKSINSLNTEQLLQPDSARTNASNTKDSITTAVSRTFSNNNNNKNNESDSNDSTNAAVLIYMQLDRLFMHLYPLKRCKFTQPPTEAQLQVCEALGVLLKLSPQAQMAANNLRLLERLMQFVQNFLEEFSITCTTTFVRRNGEHKTQAIIRNLSLLFQLILHWFSSHHAILTDELHAAKLVKIIVQIWPWLGHSPLLKQTVLNACTFLTEHSFVVCKLMSILPTGSSSGAHSILQLIVKYVNFETSAVRAQSTNSFPIVERGLRIMMNCCSCAEGRISLVKLHVLDIFDTVLPGNNSARQLKVKPDMLNAWLRFWELFSRYEQGGKVCHLNALLGTIQRTLPRNETRVLCLRILRNMCFVATNRSQLTTAIELMDTMRDIIMQPLDALHELASVVDVAAAVNDDDDEVIVLCDSDDESSSSSSSAKRSTAGGDNVAMDADAPSYEEQRLVTVCLWKLFGAGAKYKAMLRSTKLAKQLRILREHLLAVEAAQPRRLRKIHFATELAEELDQLFEALHS